MPKENDGTGNERELGRIIREHFPSLCAIACKLVGDPDTAQDIAQETLIKFWENQQAGGEQPVSVKDYLFIMVRNESLNYLRSLSRQRKRHEEAARESELAEDTWNNIIEQETNQMLQDAIDTLPPQSKRVIELACSGNSNPEIADILGIAINTVKVLKNRAVQKLKDYFAQNNT